jgi:pimeloyl-ACP methyl ester carboxylesterase
VAIDAAPIKGVIYLPLSALRVASIALRNPANRNRAPGKPLFEAAAANLFPHSPAKVNTRNETRGPLLLIAGGKDHTVPAAITKSTRRLYRRVARGNGLQGIP